MTTHTLQVHERESGEPRFCDLSVTLRSDNHLRLRVLRRPLLSAVTMPVTDHGDLLNAAVVEHWAMCRHVLETVEDKAANALTLHEWRVHALHMIATSEAALEDAGT